jgi:hypothetical protein
MAVPRHELSLSVYIAYIWTGSFSFKGFYTRDANRLARVSDMIGLSSRFANCDSRAFWLMVGVNALSGILYFFFYHPPTFEIKFTSRTKMQQFKNFDYFGTFLYTAGLLLFMMGISWGGSVSPSTTNRDSISNTMLGIPMGFRRNNFYNCDRLCLSCRFRFMGNLRTSEGTTNSNASFQEHWFRSFCCKSWFRSQRVLWFVPSLEMQRNLLTLFQEWQSSGQIWWQCCTPMMVVRACMPAFSAP